MTMVIKILKWSLISVLGLVVISIISLLIIKLYNRQINRIISKDGISYEGFLNINGFRQWICIRGENKNNPIILFVHGGPGSPESGMACKKYQGLLEKSFVMVHWEQRGAGKSYSSKIEKDSFSVDTYVNDAITLTEFLRKEYKKDKIFLIGHSWGTIIGINVISKRPDLYYAYIGAGQDVNAIEQERLSRQFVMKYLKKTGDLRAYGQLKNIGEPPYKNTLKDVFLERKYLTPSGGLVGPSYPITSLITDMLFCPYYSILDYYCAYKGAMYSLKAALTDKYWDIALDKSNLALQVPVMFISGEQDYITPAQLAEKYYNQVSAPRKELVKVANCAHMVNFEKPIEFNNEVIRFFKSVQVETEMPKLPN